MVCFLMLPRCGVNIMPSLDSNLSLNMASLPGFQNAKTKEMRLFILRIQFDVEKIQIQRCIIYGVLLPQIPIQTLQLDTVIIIKTVPSIQIVFILSIHYYTPNSKHKHIKQKVANYTCKQTNGAVSFVISSQVLILDRQVPTEHIT